MGTRDSLRPLPGWLAGGTPGGRPIECWVTWPMPLTGAPVAERTPPAATFAVAHRQTTLAEAPCLAQVQSHTGVRAQCILLSHQRIGTASFHRVQ